jgi:hypothetical protein
MVLDLVDSELTFFRVSRRCCGGEGAGERTGGVGIDADNAGKC